MNRRGPALQYMQSTCTSPDQPCAVRTSDVNTEQSRPKRQGVAIGVSVRTVHRDSQCAVIVAFPVPRQKLVELVDGMTVDHPLEHIAQVGVGLNLVQLARLDERADCCPALTAAVGPSEQMIFPSERNRA